MPKKIEMQKKEPGRIGCSRFADRKDYEEVYRGKRGSRSIRKEEHHIMDKKDVVSVAKRNRKPIKMQQVFRNQKITTRRQMMKQFMMKKAQNNVMKKAARSLFQKLLALLFHLFLSILKLALAVVLSVVLLFAPVMVIVVVMYDCPLSLFLPIYETEDTEPDIEVQDVIAEERDRFVEEITELKRTHPGCDKGKIVYDGAEGMGAYNNRNDMVAAYMCRFGIGQNAALVNTETRANMAGVVRDMCQYTTEVDVEIKYRYNEDGSIKSSYEVRTLVIHVTYKGIGQMKTEYGFDEEQCEFADMIMEVLGGADINSILHQKKPGQSNEGTDKEECK